MQPIDSQKQQQLGGAGESTSRSGRATAYDYVFFDWKGTLAMKGNLGSHQRAQLRLRRFHEALRSVLADADSVGVREVNVPILETGHSARHQPDVPAGDNKDKKHHNKDLCLPTFEMVEAAYHDLMRQYVAQQGNTFAWSAFLNKLLQKLDLESLSEESKHHLIMVFQAGNVVESELHPGAEEIIRWLRQEAGLRVGLIRNSKANEKAMRSRIAKTGINPDDFETVIMCGDVGVAKPDSEVFLRAAKIANIEDIHASNPKRILYIGNEVGTDIKGANNVGWTSVLVQHTESTSNGLADFEIANLLQLKEIIMHKVRDDNEEQL